MMDCRIFAPHLVMLNSMATTLMITPCFFDTHVIFEGHLERETKSYCSQVRRTGLFLSLLRNKYNSLELEEQGDRKHKVSDRKHEVSFQSKTTTLLK